MHPLNVPHGACVHKEPRELWTKSTKHVVFIKFKQFISSHHILTASKVKLWMCLLRFFPRTFRFILELIGYEQRGEHKDAGK